MLNKRINGMVFSVADQMVWHVGVVGAENCEIHTVMLTLIAELGHANDHFPTLINAQV